MNIDILAGKRALCKLHGQWEVCEIDEGTALLNKDGLFIPVHIFKGNQDKDINVNDLFLDAFEIDYSLTLYPEYYMKKEKYIEFIESENFDRTLEHAYVSDGDYGYYSVAKYTRNWLEKQPFDYIVRDD